MVQFVPKIAMNFVVPILKQFPWLGQRMLNANIPGHNQKLFLDQPVALSCLKVSTGNSMENPSVDSRMKST